MLVNIKDCGGSFFVNKLDVSDTLQLTVTVSHRQIFVIL